MRCSRCQDGELQEEEQQGMVVCTTCGHVEKGVLSNDTTFTKGPGGEATAVGQHVSEQAGTRGGGRIANGRLINYQRDSHDKSLGRGRQEVALLVDKLGIHPRLKTIEEAENLYKLALSRNFTRGRRTNQVAAACLYIICRQDNKPFMLIDFSDQLQVNLYVLGAVWLQLCRLFSMESTLMFTKPVDPSLYLHRFADRLLSDEEPSDRQAVANTALRMVASMKRDWMQTGRRPSGICGAALMIAAHIHGHEVTKRDVVAVVHVGQATLSKRMDEFASTSAAELSVAEFEDAVRAADASQQQLLQDTANRHALEGPPAEGGRLSAGCSHTREEDLMHRKSSFAHGMCRACYEEYLINSGGTGAGHDPPAFTRSVQKALAIEAAQAEEPFDPFAEQGADEVLALPAPGDEDRDMEAEMDSVLVGSELGVVSQALPESARVQAQQRVQARLHNPPMHPATPSPPPETGPHQQQQQHPLPAARQPARTRKRASDNDSDAGPSDPAQPAKRVRASDEQLDIAARALADAELGRESPGIEADDSHDFNQLVLYAGEGDAEQQQPGDNDEILSDLDDDEAHDYLCSKTEADIKHQLWLAVNAQYVEKQEAKRLIEAKEAANQEQADAAAAEAEGTEVEQEPSQPQKKQPRRRGRPLGSKTKVRPEDQMGPADTPQEAMRRLLKNKGYSSKINYGVLDGMFDKSQLQTRGAEQGDIHTSGPQAGNDGPVAPSSAPTDGPSVQLGGSRFRPQVSGVHSGAYRRTQPRLGTLESF